MARARRADAAASGTRPRLDKLSDCKARQSASIRDGFRSPITSTIVAHRCSDPGRSAESCAVQASQNCAAHTQGKATLLPDGQMLVTGANSGRGAPAPPSPELYNPAAGTWAVTGQMNTPG